MIELKNFLKTTAEAIYSVINVEVTIVDSNLNRIVAIGEHVKEIGIRVSKNSLYAYAIKHGNSFIIENPREHEACMICDKKNDCIETAEVCCPIKLDDKIVGVIALIAFNQKQRDSLILNKTNLLNFLNRMADLIATKLKEKRKTEKINILVQELNTLINSMDSGVILTDIEGNILQYNLKAEEIFHMNTQDKELYNIHKLLNNININKIVNKKCFIRNKEFFNIDDKVNIRIIYNVKPVISENEVVGILVTFNKVNDIISVVNQITGANFATSFDDIIGESESINTVKNYAKRASKSISTILIEGESGTGKELFARAIHFNSNRKYFPFIPINCAAIPENLLESELFGYEEGAFTGARKGGKMGKFELARKGTIFLDEIGDMPLHLQTKLLRVLQENMIEKVGGKEFIHTDVRIIAATNKDLEKKVNEGEFRKDLFYRLNVIPLYVPPLRQRKSDITILAKIFLNKSNNKLNKDIISINKEVLNIFMEYDWPGNVRELENTIEYAVNMCVTHTLNIKDLPARFRKKITGLKYNSKNNQDRIISIADLEKNEIVKALKIYGFNSEAVKKAAKELGISRATIYRKINKYNIK